MITFPDPTALQWSDLNDKLSNAGYSIAQVNGVWTAYGPPDQTQAQIDAAVQTIINGYSILSYAKKTGKQQVNNLKIVHFNTLYDTGYVYATGDIQNGDEDVFGKSIDAMLDMWASVNGSAKTATANWQKVLDTRSAAKSAINSIQAVTNGANAAATMAAVQTIINAIVWPA